MIKAVVFDAFGTLFNLDKNVLDNQDVELVDQILSYARTKQLGYTWIYSLMGQYIPFNEITLNVLQDGVQKYGGHPDLVDQLASLYLQGRCFDDVSISMQALRKYQIQMGILSNGTLEMLDKGIEKNGLSAYLDFRLSADRVRTYKPNPKVYQLALDYLSIQSNEVLFVSSNQWDVAGAANFGFQCAWLNRNNLRVESLLKDASYIEIQNLSSLEQWFV